MSEQKKKNTIILVVCMIICVILTSLLCTNSIQCSSCDEKTTGKYYLSMSGNPYCKKCGQEYYRGWPGDLDNVSDKVDNTLRNILLIIEILGFGAAIVVMNKGGIKEVKKIVPAPRPASGTTPVMEKEPVSDSKPVVEHKPVVEPKPFVTPASSFDSVEKTVSGDSGRLKTTFKPISESRIETEPPASTRNFESSSPAQSDNNRFTPAGDL